MYNHQINIFLYVHQPSFTSIIVLITKFIPRYSTKMPQSNSSYVWAKQQR